MDPIDMMSADYNCEYLGLSRLCLMENAGKAISDEVAKVATYKFSRPVKIAIFTGSGGNAGDGFVAARHLLNRGFEIEIYMLSSEKNIKSKDALTNYNILKNMSPYFSSLSISEIRDSNDLDDIKLYEYEREGMSPSTNYIVIDAILGTGISGSLREPVRSAIDFINDSNSLKISVDVPSGMNPKDASVVDIAVKPHYTISLHRVKDGVRNSLEEDVGGLIISDIGIPIEAELLTGTGDLKRIKKRRINSHKGTNGKLLIVGGSEDYCGAPALAGLSALSTGTDLVFIACPESVSNIIKSYSPDFIVKSLEGNYLNLKNLDDILEIAENVDCVLIGCGASQEEETFKLFNILANKIKKPMILDADALKLVDEKIIKNKEDLVLSPHKFEFNSFFDSEISNDFKSDPLVKVEEIQAIVKKIKGTVVLKGEYDLIINKERFKLNKTGNPSMTVGGTGDVLAGFISSLIAQGNDVYSSAVVATFLNGIAGDKAYEKYKNNFTAVDLINFLKENLSF